VVDAKTEFCWRMELIVMGVNKMNMEQFIKTLERMDLTDKILFWVDLNKIEGGYYLYLKNKKKKYYVRSLGNYHFVVYDYDRSKEVEDWEYCDKQKFEKCLRNFVKNYKIIKAVF